MNGITIMLIAIAVLGGGYLLYGRWLAGEALGRGSQG